MDLRGLILCYIFDTKDVYQHNLQELSNLLDEHNVAHSDWADTLIQLLDEFELQIGHLEDQLNYLKGDEWANMLDHLGRLARVERALVDLYYWWSF